MAASEGNRFVERLILITCVAQMTGKKEIGMPTIESGEGKRVHSAQENATAQHILDQEELLPRHLMQDLILS